MGGTQDGLCGLFFSVKLGGGLECCESSLLDFRCEDGEQFQIPELEMIMPRELQKGASQ